MNTPRLLSFILFLSSVSIAHTAQLIIHVQNPDGSPAKGVPVWEQIDGGFRMFESRSLGKTNIQGNIVASFVSSVTWTYQDIGPMGCWGTFEYTVMPPKHPWVISDKYYWIQPPLTIDSNGMNMLSIKSVRAWAKDPENIEKIHDYEVIEVTPEAKLVWNVTLPENQRYSVKMLDQFDQPIRNFLFHLFLNRRPFADVKTDREGMFNIDRINRSYLYEINSENYFKYFTPNSKSRHGEVHCRFQKSNNIIRYKKAVEYEITVYVKDQETGKPIPKATVGQNFHFPGAYQGGPIGRSNAYTDKEGKFYSKEFQLDHSDQFWVLKDGYELEERDIREYQPGGTYTFELKRKSQ